MTLLAAGLLSASATSATAGSRTARSTVVSGEVPSFTPHKESVLHAFTGADGSGPTAALIADAAGALYGTASAGGRMCCGTAFKLTPPPPGKDRWTERVLYAFPGTATDGYDPFGGLIADRSGAVYGTAYRGGSLNCSAGCGTVYKLTPPASNETAWTESVLHFFTGVDGSGPEAGLIADASGALYGTTSSGGSPLCGCGTIFKLTPPARGRTAWTESVLHTFGGADGAYPYAGLIADPRGALYSTTFAGGPASTRCPNTYSYGGCGTVFKLTPPAPGHSAWNESVLYAFSGGADGSGPLGGLISDAQGSLYGTAGSGGNLNCLGGAGCGTVFKLTPSVAGRTGWSESVLHSFTFADGAFPEARLVADTRGSLYGTTRLGGVVSTACNEFSGGGCGTVFKLMRPALGKNAWTESVLHFFTGADGYGSLAGLIDVSGHLFGTTYGNGSSCNLGSCGTVFEVKL